MMENSSKQMESNAVNDQFYYICVSPQPTKLVCQLLQSEEAITEHLFFRHLDGSAVMRRATESVHHSGSGS
jgi:hypothetical protein